MTRTCYKAQSASALLLAYAEKTLEDCAFVGILKLQVDGLVRRGPQWGVSIGQELEGNATSSATILVLSI